MKLVATLIEIHCDLGVKANAIIARLQTPGSILGKSVVLFWLTIYLFCSTQACHLYVEVKATQWPIVYSHDYNIGFLGLERLHPFDSGKWGKVFQFLKGTSHNGNF